MFSKIRPHLIAILVFLVVSLAYFSPVLSGKVLESHDIGQWLGVSKEISDYREATGEEALWSSTMFSGMPAYQISVVYAGNLIQYVNKLLLFGLPNPANLLFISLISFYILMIVMKADFRIAIAGAFAFAFCSFQFVSIEAGHNTKVHAIALIPMIVAGVLLAYRGSWLMGAAITMLGLSVQVYANHLQITYYTAIMVGLLVIAELANSVKEKTLPSYLRSSIALGIGALIAILPNITNLLLTYEYGKYSTRGQSELTEKKVSSGLDKDYALGWSFGKLETMTLLIPTFAGGSSYYDLGTKSATYKAMQANVGNEQARSFVKTAPLYWGDQPMTSGPVYNGAIPVFLFIISLFLLKGPVRIWLIVTTALFVMLAWGKNFAPLTDLFFEHFPGYSKFRSVAMALTIPSFLIPLGGMLALMRFLHDDKDREKISKALFSAFYITAGLCLIFVLLPGIFCDFEGAADEQLKQYEWLLNALREDRASVLRMDALRSIFFIAAAFGLLWAWMKNKMAKEWVMYGVAFLILIDMWSVGKQYLNNDNFVSASKSEKPFEMSAADQQILQDKSYYRVMNTSVSTFNDASTSYYHHSIGGYHGAKLKRYQELIEYQISKGNMNVINMLNTKYFIVRDQQSGQPQVQMNPGALGPAWAVSDWKIVPDADAEIKALDSLDTRQIAVIDQRYASVLEGVSKGVDSTASVIIKEENGRYGPRSLKYEVNGSKKNLVVFSEIFYPEGWNAYIDDRKVPYACANYVLRALPVPAGKHKVEFRFEPAAYYTGEKISLAGSVLLLLLFGAAGFITWRKQEKEG